MNREPGTTETHPMFRLLKLPLGGVVADLEAIAGRYFVMEADDLAAQLVEAVR